MAEPSPSLPSGVPGAPSEAPLPARGRESIPSPIKAAPLDMSDRPIEPVYRPISGLAIAGLILAVLYAVLLIVFGGAALYQGKPLLLEGWAFVPVLSGALCIAAWVQIQRSEGTRAGLALARAGLWISLLFGLGYAAFVGATFLAVRAQAETFTRGWFELIRADKLNRAYLLGQDPEVRAGVNPEDEMAMNARFNQATDPTDSVGPLSRFRDQDLIRILRQGQDDMQVTPLGVSEWDYRPGGYRIRRLYRIRTVEGEFDVLVTLQGSEGKGSPATQRQWQVILGESGIQTSYLNPLGQERDRQRKESEKFVQAWAGKLSRGELEEVYLDTRPASERPRLRAQYAARLALAGLALGQSPSRALPGALLTDVIPLQNNALGLELFMPGYATFQRDFSRMDEKKLWTDDEAARRAVREAIPALFAPSLTAHRLQGHAFPRYPMLPWKAESSRVEFANALQLFIGPNYLVNVRVTVEGDTASGANAPNWRLVSMEVLSCIDQAKARGPRNPGGT